MARTHRVTHSTHSQGDTSLYYWTDRDGRHYVRLRERHRHWNVEWGFRDPPGGPRTVQLGERLTSEPEEAVRTAVEQIRALTDDPQDLPQVERRLREALNRDARDGRTWR